jgi:hypothetical protein
VHERAGGVALGPRPQAGGVVAALGRAEQPIPRTAGAGQLQPDGRPQPRQELHTVGRPNDRDPVDQLGTRQPAPDHIRVERLPHPDGGHPVRHPAGQVDEQLRVVPAVVTDEHPPDLRRGVEQALERGALGRPADDKPPRDQARRPRQHRPRRVAVPREQVADGPGKSGSAAP